ncbi:hypothetical protein ABIE33_005938 [Ensifer sp. 4252]
MEQIDCVLIVGGRHVATNVFRLLHVSLNRIRFKETCSSPKCYSDLCASNKTRGAVGPGE